MSDHRRATLTPFGKSEKKTNKSPRKTHRFCFTLSDPNENSCPVFDYTSVVKSEERKLIKKLRDAKDKKANGLVGSLESDEDEDVRRLAQKFEDKYGDKKKKCKSYAELGAGYDETDPFIDNTEAYDEALQEDVETACGGYYINSGPLELKRVEVSDQSDADEIKKRRHKKRNLAVIEELEEENAEEVEEEEEEAEVETHSLIDDGPPEPKKAKLDDEKVDLENKLSPIQNGLEEPYKKKKRIIDDTKAEESHNKVKKTKTVKALLEEKRIQEPRVTEDPKKQIATETSICEAIESVINAGNNDENSNSSTVSQSATASTSGSEDSQDSKPGSQNAPPPLPNNLSPEVACIIDNIKRTAAVTDNTRKTFCADINNGLVKLEWKTREFSATNRNLLFAHLAHHLPCTKDTLMRRAKKLFILKEESQIDTVICKLKATIDASMPFLLEKYGKDCQRVAEEKGINVTPESGNHLGGENQLTPCSTKLPKRKFCWTEETRGYLREIVRLKKRCYKVLKPRKSTIDEYIANFLHTKIRMLWPPDWIKTSTLLRESNRSPHSGKSKHSSSHREKSDSSRLNVQESYPSPSPSISTSHSLYISPSTETPHQSMKSPVPGTTPLAANTGTEPLNLFTKITTLINPSSGQTNKLPSPGNHQNVKTDKPEMFSMDCLLKRTSDNVSDYTTTLSDLMKKDSVIMNGASLPLKNVNSSQKKDSSRNETILDLSNCNNSPNETPSVIHSVSTNDRTTMRASDSVSLSANLSETNKYRSSSSSPAGAKESKVLEGKVVKDVDRRMSEETTTATDILSQIISESLMSPPPIQAAVSTHFNSKVKEEMKGDSAQRKQELLFDVMQDLKELNHLSSGGVRESKPESKNNGYGVTWPKPAEKTAANVSQFHNEFVKHILNTHDSSLPQTPTTPYSRHNTSPYENSPYVNELNKSVYNSSSQRSSQNMSSHTGSHTNKVTQINQGCMMKTLPNTGISSGLPHRYLGQLEYGDDNQHLLGLASSLQYGLGSWPYPGNESQSHQ